MFICFHSMSVDDHISLAVQLIFIAQTHHHESVLLAQIAHSRRRIKVPLNKDIRLTSPIKKTQMCEKISIHSGTVGEM